MSGVRRDAWLTLFGVAFGVLEAAVVVYLRALYYPGGFRFPLVVIVDRIAFIELVREAATLAMLAGVAMASGRNAMDRFFVFAYLFGVWDIVYYAGLWAFLGWPPSLLTWDVLFLLPVPWLGPVIYPLLVSLFLVAGFVMYERLQARGATVGLTALEWAVAGAGAVTVVVAFCWNWRTVAAGVVPQSFPATLFTAGMAAGVAPFIRSWRRSVADLPGR